MCVLNPLSQLNESLKCFSLNRFNACFYSSALHIGDWISYYFPAPQNKHFIRSKKQNMGKTGAQIHPILRKLAGEQEDIKITVTKLNKLFSPTLLLRRSLLPNEMMPRKQHFLFCLRKRKDSLLAWFLHFAT